MKLTSATFEMNGKVVTATRVRGEVHVNVADKTFVFQCKILNNDGNEGVWAELLECMLFIYGPAKRSSSKYPVPNCVNSDICDFGDFLQRIA